MTNHEDALDVEALRKVAEAATTGPWETRPPHEGWDDYFGLLIARVGEEFPITPGGGEAGDDGVAVADATYIATFDPPTALALLDALEQAVRRAEAAEAAHERTSQALITRERVLKAERDSACAQRDAAEGKVAAVERLARSWADADGEPATRDDLTALTIANRHGAMLLHALAPDSADDEGAS